MTTSHRRIALLTGASIAALGVASPAFAQATSPYYPTPAPHDAATVTGAHSGTSSVNGPATASDTITICAIADNPACFLGVKDDGLSPSAATVNTVPTGQIVQNQLNATVPVDLAIINAAGDSAEIGAVAIASGTLLGNANADAQLVTAISQTADGNNVDVDLQVDNNGTLLIDALAVASGTGNAAASADLTYGIFQSGTATGAGDVRVTLTNDDHLVINATAIANGGTGADASASNSYAIEQYAYAYGAGDASVDLNNNGTLTIGAFASASATNGGASADANQSSGISQTAYAGGGGDATASIDNAGTINIAAVAVAVAGGGNNATASASNYYAISQEATAAGGGDALVSLSNSAAGAINVNASAYASGMNAYAKATVSHGISQSASANGGVVGGNATALIANDGTIAIDAVATALASDGSAIATASNSSAIVQHAKAQNGGDAYASMTGTGSIDVGAFARAVSFNSYAFASATLSSAIQQYATANGGGNASVILSQDGGIDIHGTAHAAGSSASAVADVGGIYQRALADGGPGGNATALISLNGANNIVAAASANATVLNAHATATVESGIDQNAQAKSGGDANATITNDGSLTISASANATADDIAYASASADGVYQYAQAKSGGDATVSMTNNDSISVLASAYASGGSALATAAVSQGISQVASAIGFKSGGGDASVTLNNAGTINVAAIASAYASASFAGASANVNTGINQRAFAPDGDASVTLTNGGTINVSASANAVAGSHIVGVGPTATTALGSAFAYATIGTGIRQRANGFNGLAYLTNAADGIIDVSAVASANAPGNAGGVFTTTSGGTTTVFPVYGADARVGIGIRQEANAGYHTTVTGVGATATTVFVAGNATASLVNDGSINVSALANATGGGLALAHASIETAGISQYASADGGNALSSLTNTGNITVSASANAYGSSAVGTAGTITAAGSNLFNVPGASAYVGAGIRQYARANAELTAFATANSGATTYGTGAIFGSASATLDNSGTIAVSANATARAAGRAGALAFVGAGVLQTAIAGTTDTGLGAYATGVGGNALVSLTNEADGVIDVSAVASATGSVANASAIAKSGVGQFVNAGAGVASASVLNDGLISLAATGNAYGSGSAHAFAAAKSAVSQFAVGSSAQLHMVNGGYVTATANAFASAGGTVTGVGPYATTVGAAYATAIARGLNQFANAAAGTAYMTNSGTLNVGAHATANGYSTAIANAHAVGAAQTLSNPVGLNFLNSGVMNVNASAFAGGVATAYGTAPALGSAYATAIGYTGFGFGGGTLTANIANTANAVINVSASATAPNGTAVALAQGILLENGATTTTVGTGPTQVVTVNAHPMGGSITNSGELTVVAFASGGTTTSTVVNGTGATATTTTVTVPHSSAQATGIGVQGGINNMTISNSGSINVDAITANGGDATAYGIRVRGNGTTATPLATDILTINNSGDIIVRVSQDGGTTFHRGTAIDVSEAPNKTVINLLGGSIYGNIDDQAGDEINVTTGETLFNGIINPECMPAGGPTALTLDDPAQNACGQGSLTISDGGNFHMLIDPVDGPSYAFVNDFTVTADGTLTLDLPPATGGTIPIGTYPQIFTETASLAGTLVANIQGGTLFDTTTYENVIDATDLTGTFDQCIINGIPTTSLLLDFGCIYDSQDNVDLKITRTPFGNVPGLNGNGTGVGQGLECIFDTSLTGGISDLLSDLFLFTDPVNYNIALNQLAGSSYANYLQSFPSLGVHYNDLIAKATDCEIPALAGSVLECRASSPIHVWGQLDYQWRKADGDSEAGTTKSRRFSGLMGIDANVGQAAILGVSAGYVTNHVRDRQFGDQLKADGYQVGAYGVYDPGAFYMKAMTSYSWYDGDSTRRINFAGLATGATFAGTTRGDPDVNMWTFGLHGGYRAGLGGNSVLTPYLNYDYVNAKLKSFTETGLDGANLTVEGGRAKHSFLTGGVKYATQFGGLVPEVNLGYRYRFGHKESDFRAAFLGDTSCDFGIASASQKRGTFLAGVSIGGKMGPVDLRIGYEGEFNSDITSHSGNFKFVLPLGGHAAPPPPPPVIAPPPPPPPVEIAPPPPPPPPPPAPVERGERGQ